MGNATKLQAPLIDGLRHQTLQELRHDAMQYNRV